MHAEQSFLERSVIVSRLPQIPQHLLLPYLQLRHLCHLLPMHLLIPLLNPLLGLLILLLEQPVFLLMLGLGL